MTKDTGGQAFPVFASHKDVLCQKEILQQGMTLRDYFAGQALMGLLSNPSHNGNFEDATEDSYKYADAMIAERSKL